MRPLLPILIMFSSLILLTCAPLVAGEHLPPGHHRGKPYGENWTFDVVVPANDGNTPMPVLFLFSPGGNPDVGRWKAWAERNAMLVVGVNDSRNNMSSAIVARMQKAVGAAISEVANAHPFLRYSAGFSGGGWCAMFMAKNLGDAHAGALVMGHHLDGFDFAEVPKHVPAYFLWGEADPAFNERTMPALKERLTSLGFTVRLQGLPNVAHTDPALPLQQQALEVLIELASVTHPRLSETERRAAWERVTARINGLADIADPDERLTQAQRLFEVPGLEQRPADHRLLLAGWFDASVAQGEAQTDAVATYRALDALSKHPRTQGIDAARRKKLGASLSALRKQPEVKIEVTASGYLDQLQTAVGKANGAQTKLKVLIPEFESLIKKYPQTQAAKDAALALEGLRKQIR